MSMPLAEAHQRILGRAPQEDQERLYTRWPKFRGFSDRNACPVRAEAVIITALMSGRDTERVLLLVPHGHEAWLLQQCEATAMATFEGCKKYPKRAKELIYGYTVLFKTLTMMSRVLQLQNEPAYWVSFGFAADDLLPPWMTDRLLPNVEIGAP
jgi:hypothetical protein